MPRTSRARPVRFSESTGFRLCGIADEPFWPGEKNSSASRTSLRCRWRISVASRSTDEATTPSVAKIHGVAVARDHLRRDRLGAEAQRAGDVFLDARIDVGEGADRARDRGGRDFLAGGMEPPAGAGEFGVGVGELQAEGRRLGVDAVAAPDGRGQLVLLGAAAKRGQQRVDVGQQDVGGADELHAEAGVEDVRRGQPLMQVAGLRPDDLGDVGQERDDVVAGLRLDLLDARGVELRPGALAADRLGRRFRHRADLGHGVEGVRLDLEPDAVAGFGRPDGRHCGARIARNHGSARVVGGDRARSSRGAGRSQSGAGYSASSGAAPRGSAGPAPRSRRKRRRSSRPRSAGLAEHHGRDAVPGRALRLAGIGRRRRGWCAECRAVRSARGESRATDRPSPGSRATGICRSLMTSRSRSTVAGTIMNGTNASVGVDAEFGHRLSATLHQQAPGSSAS